MTLYFVSHIFRSLKTFCFFIHLACFVCLCMCSEPATALTNSINQISAKRISLNLHQTSINGTIEKYNQNLVPRAFWGNLAGSVMGGIVGAGITTATGYASGGLEDADKVLYGLYVGSIIGSTLGSTIAVHSKEKREFKRLLLRAFIPHVIFSGTGLILSQVTKTPSDGVILTGMYLIGWIISPIEAAKTNRSSSINENLPGGLIEDKKYLTNYDAYNKKSFSISIKLLTVNW